MPKAKEKPLTREDVLRLIEENGGTAKGLDLSGKTFEEDINLFGLDLSGIILKGAVFPASQKLLNLIRDLKNRMPHKRFAPLIGTSLSEVKLQEADLSYARLNGINMRHAQLQKANLSFAQLVGTNLLCAQLQEASLEYANLTNAYLWGAELKDANLSNAQLEGAELSSTRMGGAYLFDAQFSLAKLEYVNWGNYILGEEKAKHFRMAAANYRELKILYHNAGLYNIAGEFFYREMEAKRKNLRWLQPRERRWLGWWPLRGEKVRLNIYRWLYGYGERPWRVVTWGGLVLFGLALIYFFFRGVAPYTLTIQTFSSSLYYSAVSFTALGYGPWFSASSVRSWVQGVGAAEAIIGVFTIALFLITFVRKMTR